MESCYGIAPDRLSKYYRDLLKLGIGGVVGNSFTKALLCLSGLHYVFSDYVAAKSGSQPETYCAPAHRLDDGLEPTALLVLKRLLRLARSRATTSAVAYARPRGLQNEEWFRLQIAWLHTGKLTAGKVQGWLEQTDIEEAWLRICIATGILSLWKSETASFVHAMMCRTLSPLIPDIPADRNAEIATLVKSFTREA